jgi:hypothetical protein
VSDEQDGGSEWELSEAIKLMGDAQASGDPEQIATAMRRHAEALTNATNTTMIPTLKNVLETVVRREVGKLAGDVGKLTLRIDATVQEQDQRFGYMLDRMGAHLEKEDARHDALAQSEDSTLSALTSVAHRLDEITSYVQQSVTLGRESKEISLRSEKTATESLAVSQSNATRLERVEKEVKDWQRTSAAQWEDLQQWKDGVAVRLAGIEQFDRDALLKRIERLDSIIADFPTRHAHDPDALVDAVIERLEQRGGKRGEHKDGE